MSWQFRVIDGGDQGRVHALPDLGIVTLGSSQRHADVSLNDLYVARVHGEVELDGANVTMTAHDTPNGTLVNGQKIKEPTPIRHGDVVRMGNSHLRLEDVEIASREMREEEEAPELDVEVIEEEEEIVTPVAVGGPATATTTSAATTTQAQTLPGSRLDELTGHALAHFHVEKVIGRGACSVVFRARDLKTNQRVALKVISPDFPSPERHEHEMQRFVHVWKAVLNLRHPYLVSLLGVGKSGPYCWLATELVEHAPLPAVIDQLGRSSAIDWRLGFRVAVQTAGALAVVHSQRLVHRNITAKHVLVRASDETAKLADLGFAAALAGSVLQQTTWRDKLQAELVYLPPEQTQPDCFVDGVCDIYSLGVVIYALLTGRFPCVGISQAETIRSIRETAPPRPTLLQPDIPPRFEAIVLKMLAKRQEDRYQRAEHLLADLQIVAEEECPEEIDEEE